MVSQHQPNERLCDSLVAWANLKTAGAKSWMKKKLEKSDNNNPISASQIIKKFLKVCDSSDLNSAIYRFTELYEDITVEVEIEKEKEESKKSLEIEATGELIFLGEIFQPLNFVPYLLTFWSLLRVWIMPISSMIMPILVLILPYFFITCVIGRNLPIGAYLQILKSMAVSSIGGLGGGLVPGQGQPQGGNLMTLISLGFTVFQSVVQSYWSHKHLKSIDGLLLAKAEKISEFLELYESIYSILKSKAGVEIFRLNWPGDRQNVRQTLAVALLYPNILKIYVQCIVEVEVWLALAKKVVSDNATIVKWRSRSSGKNQGTVFRLVGGYDPDVVPDTRVPVDIEVGSERENSQPSHLLLTGPNRGGKSTALRAIAASLYLSHTFGIALGKYCKSSIFKNFFICLTPDDLPGKKSRFEREIEFCRDILHRKNEPKIVLIDELFHSTNPPDAEFSSKVFTERLWKTPGIVSIISTHLFDFVESAPPEIGRICCQAKKVITDSGTEKLIFSYGLSEGVCRVSSVESLLRKVRLLE